MFQNLGTDRVGREGLMGPRLLSSCDKIALHKERLGNASPSYFDALVADFNTQHRMGWMSQMENAQKLSHATSDIKHPRLLRRVKV